MIEIRSKRNHQHLFKFYVDGFGSILKKKFIRCKCGYVLDDEYVDIINELKEKNLLPENFELLCCWCKFIKDQLGYLNCPTCGEKIVGNCFKKILSCKFCGIIKHYGYE